MHFDDGKTDFRGEFTAASLKALWIRNSHPCQFYFRGEFTAASLKVYHRAHRRHGEVDFRGEFTAASLKGGMDINI